MIEDEQELIDKLFEIEQLHTNAIGE